MGPGHVFHMLLALWGGPDRMTCDLQGGGRKGRWQAPGLDTLSLFQGPAGTSGSGGEQTQMPYLLLPPQTTQPPLLALACHHVTVTLKSKGEGRGDAHTNIHRIYF